MHECLVCHIPMKPFIDDIRDWEYGVDKDSILVICTGCGLVSQDPKITTEEIPSLYPFNYLAHTPASGSVGIYGRLKGWLATRTAIKIADNVPHGGVFLEIGCGNGHLMKTIAAIRPDIHFIGVDIEQIKITDLPNFNFYHSQFEDTAIESSSVDLIYCSNLIEHVPVPTVFATKIKTILKSGG
jgi:SAM-dependent methyltransferase